MNVLFKRIAAFPIWRLTGLFALGAALVASAEGTPPYVVTDLGDTYQVSGFQSKILNDQGQVIGNQVLGGAFLYASGSWSQLGTLNTTGSTNNATAAQGLNNAGLVVGQSDTGGTNSNTLSQTDGFFQAGVSGSFTALGLVSGSNPDQTAVAFGCNDLGVIVGDVYQYSTGTRSTFLYVAGSGILSNTNNNIRSFAIDRYGNVLGSEDSFIPQATLNGIPLPASTASFVPHGINNSGQILLSLDNTSPLDARWGLIYDISTGKTTSLGNLSPKAGGYTTFLDINDSGDVVGRGSDENSNPHAVLYTPAAGLVSLDALGLTVSGTAVTLVEAEGINNAGQIVCNGYTTSGTDVHAYLLTPTTTPAPPLSATYDGLATISGTNVGEVTLDVAKSGIATVALAAPGVDYSFKAALASGSFSGTAPVKGGTVNAAIQVNAGNQIISGTITGAASTYAFTALRQAPLGVGVGKYTALVQLSGPGNPALPQGIGYATMTVGDTGSVSVSGQLGDGTTYTAVAKSHYDGSWTFFAPLYTKTAQPGSIAGSIAFNRLATDSDYSGMLQWSKPGTFATAVNFQAALFSVAPEKQMLVFSNTTSGTGTFSFSGGGVTLGADTVAVSDKNVVTVPSPDGDGLKVVLSTANGAMTGSFNDPAATANPVKFAGVVQQKMNIGAGVFVGGTLAGAVELTPE